MHFPYRAPQTFIWNVSNTSLNVCEALFCINSKPNMYSTGTCHHIPDTEVLLLHMRIDIFCHSKYIDLTILVILQIKFCFIPQRVHFKTLIIRNLQWKNKRHRWKICVLKVFFSSISPKVKYYSHVAPGVMSNIWSHNWTGL